MIHSPLKYHGGKYYMARKIVSLMPKNYIHYAEPYFGSGAVLFAKECEGYSEAINDIDSELITFWTIVRDDVQSLQRYLSLTPFAEKTFEWAMEKSDLDNDIVVAAKVFCKYRMSRQALATNFVTPVKTRTRRGMQDHVSAYLSAIDGLTEATLRLQSVLLEATDALDFIHRHDGEHTLFYLDPPYMPDTRVAGDYKYDMDEEDHEELLRELEKIEGRFILSGYDNEMYQIFAKTNGWKMYDFELAKASGNGSVKQKHHECVWANF